MTAQWTDAELEAELERQLLELDDDELDEDNCVVEGISPNSAHVSSEEVNFEDNETWKAFLQSQSATIDRIELAIQDAEDETDVEKALGKDGEGDSLSVQLTPPVVQTEDLHGSKCPGGTMSNAGSDGDGRDDEVKSMLENMESLLEELEDAAKNVTNVTIVARKKVEDAKPSGSVVKTQVKAYHAEYRKPNETGKAQQENSFGYQPENLEDTPATENVDLDVAHPANWMKHPAELARQTELEAKQERREIGRLQHDKSTKEQVEQKQIILEQTAQKERQDIEIERERKSKESEERLAAQKQAEEEEKRRRLDRLQKELEDEEARQKKLLQQLRAEQEERQRKVEAERRKWTIFFASRKLQAIYRGLRARREVFRMACVRQMEQEDDRACQMRTLYKLEIRKQQEEKRQKALEKIRKQEEEKRQRELERERARLDEERKRMEEKKEKLRCWKENQMMQNEDDLAAFIAIKEKEKQQEVARSATIVQSTFRKFQSIIFTKALKASATQSKVRKWSRFGVAAKGQQKESGWRPWRRGQDANADFGKKDRKKTGHVNVSRPQAQKREDQDCGNTMAEANATSVFGILDREVTKSQAEDGQQGTLHQQNILQTYTFENIQKGENVILNNEAVSVCEEDQLMALFREMHGKDHLRRVERASEVYSGDHRNERPTIGRRILFPKKTCDKAPDYLSKKRPHSPFDFFALAAGDVMEVEEDLHAEVGWSWEGLHNDDDNDFSDAEEVLEDDDSEQEVVSRRNGARPCKVCIANASHFESARNEMSENESNLGEQPSAIFTHICGSGSEVKPLWVNLAGNGFSGVHNDLNEETRASVHGLDFSGNHIADVSFIGVLPELRWLSFQNNWVESLPFHDGFRNMAKLRFLNLEGNLLSRSSLSSIRRCGSLESINLRNNLLGGRLSSALKKMRYLQNLDLGENKLTCLPDENLANAHFLSMLRLDNNQFKTVPQLFGKHFLADMDLSGNQIKSIIEEPVENGNHLSCSDSPSSRPLVPSINPHMDALHMKSNLIGKFKSSKLLTEAKEEPPSCRTTVFMRFPFLRVLDLRNNHIERLDDIYIHNIASSCRLLENFDLRHNPVMDSPGPSIDSLYSNSNSESGGSDVFKCSLQQCMTLLFPRLLCFSGKCMERRSWDKSVCETLKPRAHVCVPFIRQGMGFKCSIGINRVGQNQLLDCCHEGVVKGALEYFHKCHRQRAIYENSSDFGELDAEEEDWKWKGFRLICRTQRNEQELLRVDSHPDWFSPSRNNDRFSFYRKQMLENHMLQHSAISAGEEHLITSPFQSNSNRYAMMAASTLETFASICLQSLVRLFITRQRFRKARLLYKSAVLIQSSWRCKIALEEFKFLLSNRKNIAHRLQKLFRGVRTRRRLREELINAKFVDDDDYDYCEVDVEFSFDENADTEWAPVLPVPPADLDFSKIQQTKQNPAPQSVHRSQIRNGGFSKSPSAIENLFTSEQTTMNCESEILDTKKADDSLHASMVSQLQKFRKKQASTNALEANESSMDDNHKIGESNSQENENSSFAAGSAINAVMMNKELKLQKKHSTKEVQERIQEEWGFSNAKTAEMMLKRRQKFKRLQNPKKAPNPMEKYQRLMKKVNKDGSRSHAPSTARSEAHSIASEGHGRFEFGDERKDMNSSRSAGVVEPGSDTSGRRESFGSGRHLHQAPVRRTVLAWDDGEQKQNLEEFSANSRTYDLSTGVSRKNGSHVHARDNMVGTKRRSKGRR